MSEPMDWENAPTIDLHILGPLCEVLEESAFEVIDEFMIDTPRLAAEAKAALGNGDYGSVAGLTHQIKSSSGALGGVRVQLLSAAVEKTALQGDTDDTVKLCQQLFSAIEDLIIDLASFRKTLAPQA